MTDTQELITRMNTINTNTNTSIAEQETRKVDLDSAIAYQQEVIDTFIAQKALCDVTIAELNANIVLDDQIIVVLNSQTQN